MADSFTVLLLHCDGADASTTFTDSETTPKTMTAVNQAQIDTAQKKFGTGSGLFDGTGDYVTADHSADWDFGSGNFTMEAWVRFNSVATTQVILAQYAENDRAFLWRYLVGTPNTMGFTYTTDGTNDIQINVNYNAETGVWHHFAVVRNGSTLTHYVDGVSIGSGNISTSTIYNSTDSLRVGAFVYAGTTYSSVNGWLDEIRISKGIARWTANFTPPTAAYNGAAPISQRCDGFAFNVG